MNNSIEKKIVEWIGCLVERTGELLRINGHVYQSDQTKMSESVDSNLINRELKILLMLLMVLQIALIYFTTKLQ